MNRNPILWSIAVITCVCIGCGEDVAPQDLGKISEAAKPPETKVETPADPFGMTPDPAQSAAPAPTDANAAPGPTNTYGQGAPIALKSEIEDPNLVKAEGGVGKRGQGYGGGIITEPVRQYFVQQDRITLNIQIPNNIKTYRALHDDKNPPTVEEFVKEVLDASNLQLPELPRGHFYVYDPSARDLDSVLLVAQRPAQ